jgi:hypothetical protein
VVEGAHVRTVRQDPGQHCIQIVQHVSRGDAQNLKAFASKQRIPRRVASGLITAIMPFSVNLDH